MLIFVRCPQNRDLYPAEGLTGFWRSGVSTPVHIQVSSDRTAKPATEAIKRVLSLQKRRKREKSGKFSRFSAPWKGMVNSMILIHQETCTGCQACVKECFMSCIRFENGKASFKGEKRCITCGHCMAVCPSNAIETDLYDNQEAVEWSQDLEMATTEGLFNRMRFRRSIRSYNKKLPEKAVIRQILDGARFAGTGGNRQALRYLVIMERAGEVAKKAAEVLGRLAENGGFYASAFKRICQASQNGQDELFYHAPVILLIIGNRKKGFNVKKDGGLATAYIQLLCETEGLGSCVNGFFGDAFEADQKLQSDLGIREGECLVNAIGIGYTDVSYLRSVPRKKLDVTWL